MSGHGNGHGHGGEHGHGGTEVRYATPEEQWDARYSESERIWSGDPNAALVREASDLAPGRALDIGCGEGGDAIWLARRGWRVTGVDVSGVALERAARHAADAGVADLVDLERHDLGASFPAGEFDLVSAHFLHSEGELPRAAVLRRAAEATARGGVLLIVGHAAGPEGAGHAHPDVELPSNEEVLADLALDESQWHVLVASQTDRVQRFPSGETLAVTDNTLKLRRR